MTTIQEVDLFFTPFYVRMISEMDDAFELLNPEEQQHSLPRIRKQKHRNETSVFD